jgi:hypothetical protein
MNPLPNIEFEITRYRESRILFFRRPTDFPLISKEKSWRGRPFGQPRHVSIDLLPCASVFRPSLPLDADFPLDELVYLANEQFRLGSGRSEMLFGARS